MKQKKHLMVDNYMVDEVLDKIKEIIGIEIVKRHYVKRGSGIIDMCH